MGALIRGFPAWFWAAVCGLAALLFLLTCAGGALALRLDRPGSAPVIAPTLTVPNYGTRPPTLTPLPSVTPVGYARPIMETNTDRRFAEIDGVPLVPGVDIQAVTFEPTGYSYLTRKPYDQVINFYREEMVLYAWVLSTSGQRLTSQVAELTYTRDERTVRLVITRLPFVGVMVMVEEMLVRE